MLVEVAEESEEGGKGVGAPTRWGGSCENGYVYCHGCISHRGQGLYHRIRKLGCLEFGINTLRMQDSMIADSITITHARSILLLVSVFSIEKAEPA